MARPRKFNTVEEMQEAIQAYFDKQENAERVGLVKGEPVKVIGLPVTIQGLALTLGFNSRQALLNYEGYTDENDKEFLDTIKKAKLYIENSKVEGGLVGALNTTMVIFDLKNNHGHTDKKAVDVDHTTGGDKIQSIQPITWGDDGKDKK